MYHTHIRHLMLIPDFTVVSPQFSGRSKNSSSPLLLIVVCRARHWLIQVVEDSEMSAGVFLVNVKINSSKIWKKLIYLRWLEARQKLNSGDNEDTCFHSTMSLHFEHIIGLSCSCCSVRFDLNRSMQFYTKTYNIYCKSMSSAKVKSHFGISKYISMQGFLHTILPRRRQDIISR